MVRTTTADIAWRTIDAQYCGVPQRRRRIFIVADFGGKCAGKILFIEEGVSWNPATSGEAGEETSRAVGNGIKDAVGLKGYRMTAFGEYADDDCSSALKARDYKDATDLIVNAQLYDMTHADEVIRPVKEGIAPTLNSRMGTGGNQVPMMVQNRYVRRLTPLECLRLQGYPDWWLDVDGMSDTAKYKAIGNSVAIPCVDFVLGGIAMVLMNY
jgi:DNA (cytosine-5)-methyltransferase 1